MGPLQLSDHVVQIAKLRANEALGHVKQRIFKFGGFHHTKTSKMTIHLNFSFLQICVRSKLLSEFNIRVMGIAEGVF